MGFKYRVDWCFMGHKLNGTEFQIKVWKEILKKGMLNERYSNYKSRNSR